MDQFSHDLTIALEETSLLDRARVRHWGQQRRRTRSTGNLPCAPQPTEDSSSPTDLAYGLILHSTANNNDGLNTQNIQLPSDSDEKDFWSISRTHHKHINTSVRLSTLESDSLNENFSPARFFKPSTRRKRKLKRIAMEYEMNNMDTQTELLENNIITNTKNASLNTPTSNSGTIRKRILKTDPSNRAQLLFCGKRKRSNRDRDRYQEFDITPNTQQHTNIDEYRVRPRSFSSTSKPHSDRLLPLNKGLLSKIERISQLQRIELNTNLTPNVNIATENQNVSGNKFVNTQNADGEKTLLSVQSINPPANTDITTNDKADKRIQPVASETQKTNLYENSFRIHRKKTLEDKNNKVNHRSSYRRHRLWQFNMDHQFMDCEELNDFSSSSLSSFESDDDHAANDTDREGDDELTDWPGNENLYSDSKRKLTKKSTLPRIKSDPESINAITTTEDDTVMSDNIFANPCGIDGVEWPVSEALNMPYRPSEPITILAKGAFCGLYNSNNNLNEDNVSIPLKQIESEMSGEASTTCLGSPASQTNLVREIRAGCRRLNGERPGFSIRTSINESLSQFLQDPQQLEICLSNIEMYEHSSLINLAALYSLQITLENHSVILKKTSNTTQSVNIDQCNLQNRLLLSDYKRRCYESNDNELLPK